ncbi:MAG: hypothetical protein KJ592_00320, partial [Nanoarchaeota archaeon]|nr:hypothetical protein [Nanoarchaeota archaeon]
KSSPDESFSEKTLVFIDAGFLSKISKQLGNGKYIKYDIEQLSKILSSKENLIYKKIFYYTSPPFKVQDHQKKNQIDTVTTENSKTN